MNRPYREHAHPRERNPSMLQEPESPRPPRSQSVPMRRMLIPRQPSHINTRSSSRSPPGVFRRRERGESHHVTPSPRPTKYPRVAATSTFSYTSSGIGVSILGAIVGGLAARELSSVALPTRSTNELKDAVDVAGRSPYTDPNDGLIYHPPHPRARRPSSASRKEAHTTRMVSTVVGAMVGGIGANVIERRLESSQQRHHADQKAWENKFGRDGMVSRDERAAHSGRVSDHRYNETWG